MTDINRVSKRRHRLAYALFAFLIALIAAASMLTGWHSADVVDSRTQIEMIRGVADHGLPYNFNGPVSQFHELQARWNIAQGERVWGAYPPLLAYVSWPFFRAGNIAAVSRMIWLLVILFAAGTFALASQFFRDPLLGVVSAYLAVFSTPVAATAVNVSAFILCEALIVWTIYFALLSLELPRISRRLAFCAGLVAGLSMGAHLLAFPMSLGVMAVVALPDVDETRIRFRGGWTKQLEPWVPTRPSFIRATAIIGGAVIVLIPVGILNHARFKSFNPISYGPCVWESCAETGIDQQSAGMMLRYSFPSLIWVGAAILGFWRFARDRLGLAVVSLLALAVLTSSATLLDHTWQLFKIAWAYVVDITPLNIPQLDRPHDKIGLGFAGFAIRSVLQSTPLLVLAPFVPIESARDRRLALLLGLPSFLLLLLCALRANEPAAYALGFPYLYLRYTVPALTPLLVLSVASIRTLPWEKKHAFAIAIVAIAMTVAFHGGGDDRLWRRLILLYATLASALLAGVALWQARRPRTQRKLGPAADAAAMAIALGIGCTVGVTFPAARGGRDINDARLAAVARDLPQRFALVGFSPEIDTPLSLRATRDVQYMDLYETNPNDGWNHFRAAIDFWADEDRPVFAVWPTKIEMPSPWNDVAFELVDKKEGVFRVRKL